MDRLGRDREQQWSQPAIEHGVSFENSTRFQETCPNWRNNFISRGEASLHPDLALTVGGAPPPGIRPCLRRATRRAPCRRCCG
jgi:hypothetical protein